MTRTLLISALTLVAVSSQASSYYMAGSNDYWNRNQAVSTAIHSDGIIGLDSIGKNRLNELGYEQKEKSLLKDVWAFEKDNYSGKVFVNRRDRKSFESVIVQNTNPDGKQWADISIFEDGNVLVRRTTCRDRKCFVVTKSICDKLSKSLGYDIGMVSEMQKSCNALSTAFKTIMKAEYIGTSMETDLRADLKKVTNNPTNSRNIVMGEDIDASAQNLYSYLSQCNSMRYYNKAGVMYSERGTTAPGNQGK